MSVKRSGYCKCCDRFDTDISGHHLIPKSTHGNKRIGKMFTREEMTHRRVDVCQPCHKTFHMLFIEKVLALEYNTLELLMACPEVVKHIEWVKKQRPGFHLKGLRKYKRRK